jgi:tRNA(Ile)-lysidine synthase
VESSKNLLVTAHNADDNIETMLMFLFRGTGIHGLTGIKPFDKERKIIRPLLFAKRQDIEGYAKENNIHWVEDSSNATNKYTRNFFRRKIIPSVQEQYPNAKNNLFDNIKRFKEAEELYEQAMEVHKKQLLTIKGNEVQIPILLLQKKSPVDTILWEIIKTYNFHPHQVDEIKKLLVAGNSSYVRSATHRIIRNRKWLVIVPNETTEARHISIEPDDATVKFAEGILHFEKLSSEKMEESQAGLQMSTTNNIASLDAKQVQFPLLLRQWKQGDYFYPLGMQKKKKLSRFFIDRKLSSVEKEQVWVLEMDKKIIWVIGQRIDDRFKITGHTKEILNIRFDAEKIKQPRKISY